MRAVEGVGKAEIEGAVPAAVWIELRFVHRIDALGSLAVALRDLRSEPPGPFADRIRCKAMEAAVAHHPELELELAFEDAHENGRAERDAVGLEAPLKIAEIGRPGKREAEAGHRHSEITLGADPMVFGACRPECFERKCTNRRCSQQQEQRRSQPQLLPRACRRFVFVAWFCRLASGQKSR